MSSHKVLSGFVTKPSKRARVLDPLCYLKFAITNSFNMKQKQLGADDRKVTLDVRLWQAQKSLAAQKMCQAANQFVNRKVDQLKRSLKAVLKTSSAKLSSAQVRKKIDNLEMRMKRPSGTKPNPKFELNNRRRIYLR